MARSRQYADRVNVIKMVKVDGKWPFAKVVERNGRIVRDHVWVAGQDEHHPEGRYYLEWYEQGRRRRKPVEHFDQLVPAARAKSIELNAIKAGLLALPEPEILAPEEPVRLRMDRAIDDYLDYIRKHRSLRTFRTYRPVLNFHFRNSYGKTYVDEVDRSDVLKFMSDLFDYGLAARTVYDRLVVVLQFFKRHGFKALVERSDWPSYVETIRPIYEPEETHGNASGSRFRRGHPHQVLPRHWLSRSRDSIRDLEGH
jgi:integrase/recombinase XerD